MRSPRCLAIAIVGLSGVLLSGCVLSEKYEAEKARAVNFQRLLATEEKRTGELNAEIKKVRRDAQELEARNRELAGELQAIREQMTKLQEEAAAHRETAARKQDKGPAKKPASEQKPDQGLLGFGDPLFQDPSASALGGGVPVYHEVKPGETLYRLSRQYGVSVDTIKQWNHLDDDLIEIGQQLIIGYE
ncbi:MAG: LysM peptidoglycan-binding domain-containing protein [Nitrospirales bacterium]